MAEDSCLRRNRSIVLTGGKEGHPTPEVILGLGYGKEKEDETLAILECPDSLPAPFEQPIHALSETYGPCYPFHHLSARNRYLFMPYI